MNSLLLLQNKGLQTYYRKKRYQVGMEVGRLHGFKESGEYSALIDSYVDGRTLDKQTRKIMEAILIRIE